jgi:hypothetical protein
LRTRLVSPVSSEGSSAEPDRLLAIADGDKELRQRLLGAAAPVDEVEQAA